MAKKKNPLSDSPRKKRSYVGDFDELMADISDEEDNETAAGEEAGDGDDNPDSVTDSTARAPRESPRSKTGLREEAEEEVETPKKPLNLKIDESLHTRFKGVVGMQGRTMTEVLEEFMRDYVRTSLKDLDL